MKGTVYYELSDIEDALSQRGDVHRVDVIVMLSPDLW